MERVALAIWRNRISPLFDVAKRIFIVDIENGVPNGDNEDLLFSNNSAGKVSRLCDLNIHTLICGAISKDLSRLLSTRGIQVIPFIAGDKDDVLCAYLKNGLGSPNYCMPGCSGMRIKRRRRAERRRPLTLRSGPQAGNSKGVEYGKTGFQRTSGN